MTLINALSATFPGSAIYIDGNEGVKIKIFFDKEEEL
jgi:hypothetical protein